MAAKGNTNDKFVKSIAIIRVEIAGAMKNAMADSHI